MNDLDKQVGSAKGWVYYNGLGKEQSKAFDGTLSPLGEGFLFTKDGRECHIDSSVCRWSTLDEQALELVDELKVQWRIIIECMEENGWRVKFIQIMRGRMCDPVVFTGQHNTMAKAICRAYIAARESLAAKAVP